MSKVVYSDGGDYYTAPRVVVESQTHPVAAACRYCERPLSYKFQWDQHWYFCIPCERRQEALKREAEWRAKPEVYN